MEVILGILLALGIFIVIYIPFLLYNTFAWGYVASIIYGWYVLPLSGLFPEMEWYQFAGIMFFVNCFVHTSNYQFKEDIVDTNKTISSYLLAPWLVLLGAYVFKLFFY